MAEPKRIGKYEILDDIGRGGFAVVYRARDTSLDRIIALKVLHTHVAENPAFVQRFDQEARTAARFDHPHIVTIYEVGEQAGQHYIAMKYLAGRGLDQRLAEAGEPLPLEQVASIVEQVAGALDYIHRRGSVHRDVKPSNVMLSDEGRATLLDFGIVRAADGTKLTTTGEMMGTPQYMSPEQAEGKEIDHRSDVYALGVMAYQMCTGRAPFDDVSPLVVLRLHADKSPPSPRELNLHLPVEVERVLLKALAKKREERYQSAGEFARALREVVEAAERARQREEQLGERYEQLKAAVATKDWGEVLALGGQIQAVEPDYRDVTELVKQARKHARRPKRPTMPAWAWSVGVGLVILVILGAAVVPPLLKPRPLVPVATPAEDPTEIPTELPAKQPTAKPSPTPTPKPDEVPVLSAGDTWTRPADGMVMVYVPAGEFEMGSIEGDNNERPVHTVALDAFWLDRTEVTNAQFAAFLNERGNQVEDDVTWLDLEDNYCLIEQADGEFRSKSSYADHPVIDVTWYGAAVYCAWAGARLPTEAEWEYAARGPEGHIYPWGNEDPTCDLAQYNECSGRTVPVRSLPDGASWCGALDLAGNVWEWVADWYDGDYYERSSSRNPAGPSSGEYRVLRGGSWYYAPEILRSAYRSRSLPDLRYYVLYGFRCARGSE